MWVEDAGDNRGRGPSVDWYLAAVWVEDAGDNRGRGPSVDWYLAAVWVEDAGDELEGGALAAARGTHNCHVLTTYDDVAEDRQYDSR